MTRGPRTRFRVAVFAVLAAALAAALLASVVACSPSADGAGSADGGVVRIAAVGAESQYADVISQVGGRYVKTTAIIRNPDTDPHTYEASIRVAQTITSAGLVVQNGLGYDDFMGTIEDAEPSGSRQVIVVQRLLGLPDSTPNPHLWYQPGAMVAVADAVAAGLAKLEPAHASYFRANAKAFVGALTTWHDAINAFKSKYPDTPVATTEPVADYLLTAMGTRNLTPWTFQAGVMNGTDPSAQDIAAVRSLFTQHKVRVLVYNQQVTDPLTESFVQLAHQNGIPVVGVYETMPTPGYDYQSWMMAEVHALHQAIAGQTATEQTEHL